MRTTVWGGCGLLLLVLSLGTGGCGGGLVKPSGKILKDGQPFTLSDKGMFIVTLLAEGGGKFYPADTKRDGTFVISGAGMPSGKYKIAIEAMDPYPGLDPKNKGKDLLGGRFNQINTPILRDITSSEIQIDVGKAGGKS